MKMSNKFLDGPKREVPSSSTWDIALMPIVFMLVMPIGFTLAEFVVAGVYQLIGGNIAKVMTYIYYVQLIIGFGLAGLVLFLFVKKTNKKSLKVLGLTKTHAFKRYIKGFALGAGLVAIIVGTLALSGSVKVSLNPVTISFSGIMLVLVMLVAWTIQSGAEELLLRGYMLPRISARLDVYKGIVISSIVFAILHLNANSVDFVSLFNILLCGVALSLLTIKDESLWAACGFHAAWNIVQGNVFGVAVSGQNARLSLLNVEYKNATLLNGGVFGIEGSLLTTIVMIILITLWMTKVKKLYLEDE